MKEISSLHLLFGFGNTCLPSLPGGWIIVERPGHFVLALSPTDRLYFVARDKLHPISGGEPLSIPELVEDRNQLKLAIEKANQ